MRYSTNNLRFDIKYAIFAAVVIHRLLIENFFSIAEAQDLDFEASAKAPDLECFRHSRGNPNQRLPSVIGIYGTNASGKTTALRAITATAGFVQHSFSTLANDSIRFFNPYAHNDWWSRPSRIVIEYDSQLAENSPGAVFRYELQVGHHPLKFAREIVLESLSYSPKGKFRRIFERNKQDFAFGKEFGITTSDSRTKSIRANASVISTLAQLNHKFSIDMIRAIQGLQTNVVGLDKGFNGLAGALNYYAQNPNYLQKLNRELSRLDLGLEEMKLSGNPPIATFKHFGLDCDINLAQESSGTRRFIEIFPLLQYALDIGGVAVIDELDTDIHANLIPEIFRWFYDAKRNPQGAQLLFTAHNPVILDELEKEQVFFTEKPTGKPTRIYGASEIQGLRRQPSLMKKYLSGELGAVPHIG